ncbi:hypothetical protein IV203_029472 [Nitzschia inconspicua]|uniref:Uncharacterized protein n=1 Tax=Nitzschia inconspicua TaxID=303405 RepID=A0A9K3LR70_9STRA|nr:hypothetical protein IV203_029472 [Nitzschia inconspicua]
MSGNMESLLMGGDSSSGESDDESTPIAGGTITAPPAATTPQPAPMAAPAAPTGGSADDMKARLKSLYSASKSSSGGSGGGGGGASAPVTQLPRQSQPPPQQQQLPPPQVQRPPPQYQQQQQQQQRPQYQQPPPQQQQQQHQQQQQQRPMQQNYPQQQQQQQPPPQQQQQQQQLQTQRQNYPPSQQARPSSQSMRPPPQRPPQQQPQQHHIQQQRQSHPQQLQQPQIQQQQPQMQQQQQQRGQISSTARADPFAPTPLVQIQHRAQNRMSQQQQQQQQQQQRGVGTSATSSRSVAAGSGSSTTGRELTEQEKRELHHRKQKEKFLMFTRVLIKYLEGKDRALHAKAKLVIKDCAERNKRGEPGYESVTMAMQRRLKDLVGETYWKKAQEFLYYMHQKRKQAMEQGAAAAANNPSQPQTPQPGRQMTDEQKRQYIEAKRKQQAEAAAKAKAAATPSIDNLRQEIHEKQIALQNAPAPSRGKSAAKNAPLAGAGSPPAPAPAAAPLPAVTKGKKTQRRKSDGSSKTSSRKSSTKAPAPAPAPAPPAPAPAPVAPPPPKIVVAVPKTVVVEPPREYEELMSLIDHAVDYDWPSIGQLLGSQNDLNLSEEERQLLYGDSSPKPVAVIAGADAPHADDKEPTDGESLVTPSSSGWGKKNVLSVRAAWAALRLKEQKRREHEASIAGSPPTVAGGLLKLPSDPTKISSSTSPTSIPESVPPSDDGVWVDEGTAEKDAALALLSEGCQIYLRGVLEKAMQCARQRQNLDGIRLWHQQYALKEEESKPGENTGDAQNPEKSKIRPPLQLRLGCDVSRQIAQAQGNAALTVKRMEEALERQPNVPSAARMLTPETLAHATSMNDLAWRPLLKEGAQKADFEAKRSFEIYGGKESKDPPLGRVPKKAKLVVEDFIMGSKLSADGNYQRAYTASSFIYF